MQTSFRLRTCDTTPCYRNLEVAERSALRSITKIRHPNNPLHNIRNETLYDMTEIQPIKQRHDKLQHKFINQDNNWRTLQTLCHKWEHQISKIKKPKQTLFELYNKIKHVNQA